MNNTYIVDMGGVNTRKELHDRIEKDLPVPEWYGRNLDALYDILTEPCFGDGCTICFIGCESLKNSMPRYLAAMQQMCSAASEVNSGLLIEFTD